MTDSFRIRLSAPHINFQVILLVLWSGMCLVGGNVCVEVALAIAFQI